MATDLLPYTVAFADAFHADGIELARSLFQRVLLWSDEDYESWIEEADGICNRAKRIPSEDLLKSKKVKVLSKQGVGARTGEVNLATSVMGRSLYGKTIGVVGMGNIGRATAEKFQDASKCKVIAYDPYAPKEIWAADGDRRAIEHTRVDSIEAMLDQVDVLSLHLPLLPSTRGLINKETFKQMKREAIVINAARGGIVNEHDLYEALRDRIIAGAALDALETEPPTKEAYGDNFYTLNNVLLTPHIGAATHEMQSLSARTVVRQLAALLQGEKIDNIVK
ncbi:hypothetical protein JCM8097_002001 [Rhodosporidiobolus ruineniae]